MLKLKRCSEGRSNSMPSASKRDENSRTPSSVTISQMPPAVGEGAGHRVADAGLRVLVRRYAHAVDDDPDFVGPGVGTDSGQHVLDQPHLAARVDPHETLREQQRQFFDDPLPFAQYQRCADDHALSVAGENPGRHVIHAEAAHLLPRNGRKGVPARANSSLR